MNNYIVETNQLSKDFSGEVPLISSLFILEKMKFMVFWDQMVLVRVLL